MTARLVLSLVLLFVVPLGCASPEKLRQNARCTENAQGCRCESASTPSDVSCGGEELTLDHYCCAEKGWPAKGTACECELTRAEMPAVCDTNAKNTLCICYPGNKLEAGDTRVAACDIPGIHVCCRQKDLPSFCACSNDEHCTEEEDEVPKCDSNVLPHVCKEGALVDSCTDL